ncbi:c-type cytochrome biogenesis protein CcmI [Beijerinckia indica]|uniref:Cytochrome c-type biogenesis protein CcmI n=1 Tax=Beijerinckia indica subsp. indica (strain ATCC 9039 / DSM 1715 / NCIMB 8712) TaxID=395963 RepID=B2IGT7_BEII9|nr:c-type cytochrome biogenesis protein CcmI [Beijerinckia indica]ACB95848.1 cytochrome c-type biogenesis protein CcmI [Beijerinckia indica subsp. indica ATCC 9039]
MLWVVFAVLTGLAVMSVLWPLARKPLGRSWRDSEADFYQAQVKEIEQDVSRGLLSAQQAEAMKAETARRFIADAGKSPDKRVGADLSPPYSSPWPVRIAALLALIIIPAITLGLYTRIGTPDQPDDPLQARLDAQPQSMDIMAAIAKIEAHLRQAPDDARGYELLAPIYMRLGRFDDASKAYAEILRLEGETATRQAAYGEALVFAAKGEVTSQAQAAFAASSDQPRSRFYLGLAAEQAGDKAKARDIWNQLLADAPADAAFVPLLRQRLAELDGLQQSGEPPNSPSGSNASAANIPQGGAAIAAMPEAERNAAIHTMVDRLAARLAEKGEDLEGWLRLIRAYTVLKEEAKAHAALADARRALAGNQEAVSRIDALAHELGLEG